MHRAHMLSVHRARLLAGSRRGAAAAPDEDESRVLCAVVASVTSLMLFCGLLSVVPSPRAFGLTRTYVVLGVGAATLLLLLVGWIVASWMGALAARHRAPAQPPPAPVRLALRQICACGLGDAAALAALPTFPYESAPPRAAASEGTSGGETARGSCALCAVCLEDVRAGEMVRQLPACGHLFHVCCVDVWLRSHRTCPICRCELPPRGVATKAVAVAVAAAVVSAQTPEALPPV